jgi:L,D-transpeptidase YcbB
MIFSLLIVNLDCMRILARYVVFLWVFTFPCYSQKQTLVIPNVATLDSLIHEASSFALQRDDYAHQTLDSIILGHIPLDSARVNSIAQSFFRDLRDGNRVPNLRYQAMQFERKPLRLTSNFRLLANNLNNSSPEVIQLLAILRDSVNLSREKKNLVIKAVNEYRWLSTLRQNRSIVLVNIPSTTLRAFDGQVEKVAMRVVVGKASRPTKTLLSPIKNLIITPYWNVPRSISVEELVPEIRKNIRYFYASHLEIFDAKGRKVAPEKVPWSRLNKNYFPYEMRQRSGKWNTLGIMKFQFDNPFRMYLHDTSEKKLFKNENRFYSHSCIRVERPIELGRFLLKPHSKAVDTLDVTAAYSDLKPRYIKINRSIPLVIWYSLVDFDANGQIKFYSNIYGRN